MTEVEAELARHPPEAFAGAGGAAAAGARAIAGYLRSRERGPARGRGSTAAGRAAHLCGAATPGARRVERSLEGLGAGAPPSPKNEGRDPACADPPRHGRGSNP